MRAMARNLIFVKKPNFEGFGCSECNWVYKPDEEIAGLSLEDMMKKFEAHRDKEFAAHGCHKGARTANVKAK
jgi:hypothetical protein